MYFPLIVQKHHHRTVEPGSQLLHNNRSVIAECYYTKEAQQIQRDAISMVALC